MASNAHALVVRNKTKVNRELLERLPHIRVIGRLWVGLDNIDLHTCREKGVVVVAAKGCNAHAVAEYVIAGIFQHARFLSACDAHIRAGAWDRLKCMGYELSGNILLNWGDGNVCYERTCGYH